MTKEFEKIQFDPELCRKQAHQFRDFLAQSAVLKERKQILPFFKQRKQLSVFLGLYHPEIVRYDLLAHELPLFGDFACDLVVGDSKNFAYAFIEFEDAASDSIFTKKRGKATPEWSRRFEHGFSQLFDWFFQLHDQEKTVAFADKFGSQTIKHLGLLVIGRTQILGRREEERLRWRQQHVLIHSKQIHCITFDQLCQDILDRLVQFPLIAKAETKGT